MIRYPSKGLLRTNEPEGERRMVFNNNNFFLKSSLADHFFRQKSSNVMEYHFALKVWYSEVRYESHFNKLRMKILSKKTFPIKYLIRVSCL